jgi:hypothetical protein
MFCETEAETYADPARELVFQVAGPYLERVGITATDLMFSPAQHRALLNDGPRFQDILQRIALLQGQHTKRPVSERMKELTAMAEAVMQRVESRAAALPDGLTFEAALKAGLFHGSKLDEWVLGGVVFARLLAGQADWLGRAGLCLDMIEAAAGNEAHAMADQTLSEILRLKPAAATLFGDANRRRMIDLCLWLAGGASEVNASSVLMRLRRGLAAGNLERCQSAVRLRLSEMLGGSLPLYSSEAYQEFTALLALKNRVIDLPLLSDDESITATLTRRFTRFAAPELLNPLLGHHAEFARKILTLLRLNREIEEGNARFELQGIISHYMEHREFTTKFVGAQAGKDEFSALSTELSTALLQADIPEPRKSRLLELYRNQLANVVRPTGPRSGQRGQGGSRDAVLIGGVRIPLKNWSPVGLLFGPCPPAILGMTAVGGRLRIEVEIRTSLQNFDFNAEAEVLRVADGIIAARYLCADTAMTQRIQAYFST